MDDHDQQVAGNSLVLIDAMALAYRSFHAIPFLTTPVGQPINAAYGFASTLLHIIAVLKPKYLAVAFDESGPTFRHEEFAAYKATRPEAPDALKSQFPIIRELVPALGLPSFSVQGYEADDVIGTLAQQAQAQRVDVVIATGDHDMYQLVNYGIKVYNLSRGVKDAELIGEDEVRAHYGFGPERVTDYKGLRGDTSDNIPGVPGVGPKTAKRLIVEFGDLDELYAALNCGAVYDPALKNQGVTEKLKEKLCANKDQAFLSRQLATIHPDVPVTLELPDTVIQEYDQDKAASIFTELGFKSLIPRLPESRTKPKQHSLF